MVKIVNGELLTDHDARIKLAQYNHHLINNNTPQSIQSNTNHITTTSSSAAAQSQQHHNSKPHQSTTTAASDQYLLFGLPPIIVENIQILPHIYVPVLLSIYFIGTSAFIFALFLMTLYRWHLKQKLKHQRQFIKLQQTLNKSNHSNHKNNSHTPSTNSMINTPRKPIRKLSDIHTIHDAPSQHNTTQY